MRTIKPASVIAIIVALILGGSAFAADPVNIQIMALAEEPGSMTLTVSAVDQNGKPFPALQASNFNAWINGTALIVKSLQAETERQPASVLLLVDVSGSMAGEPMTQARAAMQQFIDVLEPGDQVAVMSFAAGVALVQDFTADRGLLSDAVARLTPQGETALYDAVIQAAGHMASAPPGRELIVLLSDGVATVAQGNRNPSIQAAVQAGVGIVAVGLGNQIDRQYLAEVTSASGGRFLEAATPAALRQAFTDLAFAIRSQYTLQIEVPRSVDRTVPGTLKVHVIRRADNAFAERHLEPLAGAVPPPFRMSLQGLAPGDKPQGIIPLVPAVEEGIEIVKLDYVLDGEVIHTTDAAAAGYDLDASKLASGSHVLKVVATDMAGREGEVQVPFLIPEVPVAGTGAAIPWTPLAVLALLAILAFLVYRFLGKEVLRRIQTAEGPAYESRISSWASMRSQPGTRPEGWPERPEVEAVPRPIAVVDPLRGRLVVMDEDAVRNGQLEGIREFEMRASPLSFGSGPNVDVRVDDAGGTIAAEEARIWVQRGRLVYHKLTTLSAMATEGVTAGWQFLDDGEEMRIGPFRLIFQAQQEAEPEAEDFDNVPTGLPQEHGMALRPTVKVDERFKGRDLLSWAGAEGPPLRDGGSRPAETPGGSTGTPQDLAAAEPPGEFSSWAAPEPAPGWNSEVGPDPADAQGAEPAPGGQILQPENWNSFVSGGDFDAPSAKYGEMSDEDAEAGDESDRAWGT